MPIGAQQRKVHRNQTRQKAIENEKSPALASRAQTDDKVLAKSAGILFIKSTNSFIIPAC
jgi:hypothetical protein